MERPNYGITKRRAVALAVMIALIFTGYSARLFQIQIVDGDEYADLASRNSSVEVPIRFLRGEILDRYMRPMAVNRTSFSAVFDYAFFPRGSGDEEQRQQNAIILPHPASGRRRGNVERHPPDFGGSSPTLLRRDGTTASPP